MMCQLFCLWNKNCRARFAPVVERRGGVTAATHRLMRRASSDDGAPCQSYPIKYCRHLQEHKQLPRLTCKSVQLYSCKLLQSSLSSLLTHTHLPPTRFLHHPGLAGGLVWVFVSKLLCTSRQTFKKFPPSPAPPPPTAPPSPSSPKIILYASPTFRH